MAKLNKKFFFTNEKGEKEEVKITPEGSMWILAYGYDTVAEWKRIKKLAKAEDILDEDTAKENNEPISPNE